MKLDINSKIFTSFQDFESLLNVWKANNETIVFTNGCFDIIHKGHVDSLQKSANLGTKLIVGLNSDESVKILKGTDRPILDENTRAIILASFSYVDAVIIFGDETPAQLIAQIIPDVLVKGKQYDIEEIAGHEAVLKNGGKVVTLDLVPAISTSEIIRKIKNLK